MAKGVLKDRNRHAFEIYRDLAERFGPSYKGVGYDLLAWLGRRSLVDHLTAVLAPCLHPDRAPYRVLDLGCGNGLVGHELLVSLKRHGVESHIDGIDFVPSNLQMATELFGYNHTLLGDITEPASVLETFPAHSYDGVFCCEVFQYIHPEDYESFVGLIHELLKREGFLLLVMPNMRGIEKRCYRALLRKRFQKQFKYGFDKTLVMDLLHSRGFSCVCVLGTLVGLPVVTSLKPSASARELLIHQVGLLARVEP